MKFFSESASPPQLVEVQKKGRPRPRSGAKLARETTQLSLKTRPMRRTMRRHSKSVSNCGRGSAVLACLISLSFRICRLA
jgi:hypothetical protein